MRSEGWAFMLISVGSVLALVSFCYYKLLTMNTRENRGDARQTELPQQSTSEEARGK